KTPERERIADLGEAVYRAVVNISPHRCICPNRGICEIDLAPHRQLPFGKVKKPDWLSTESIRQLFGCGPVQSFRSAYRRHLEETAGLGKCEEAWKESIKAAVLHGTEEFVAGILKELKGDRREQTGMREKERLSLEWSRIVAAIAKVWKAPWEEVSRQRGNG